MWHIATDVPECHSMQIQPVPGSRRACRAPLAVSLLTVVAAVAGWPAVTLAAPKTDVVELNNGDRITCEMKSLEHNQLKVSTSSFAAQGAYTITLTATSGQISNS